MMTHNCLAQQRKATEWQAGNLGGARKSCRLFPALHSRRGIQAQHRGSGQDVGAYIQAHTGGSRGGRQNTGMEVGLVAGRWEPVGSLPPPTATPSCQAEGKGRSTKGRGLGWKNQCSECLEANAKGAGVER